MGWATPSPSRASENFKSALVSLENTSEAMTVSPLAASSFSSASDRVCSRLSRRMVR